MKISVIIPTHKRHQQLEKLLKSIEKQLIEKEEFEVLVVTNLKDHYLERVEFRARYPNLNLNIHCAGRLGVNRSRNLGIQKAKSPLALLIDDDCLLSDEHYLEKIINCHKNNPNAVAIGGTYTVGSDEEPIDLAYNVVARYWQSLDSLGVYNSSRLVGGNVSYKVLPLIQSGQLFDEDILFGGTESEFHYRLNQQGIETLYFSSLKVTHKTKLTVNDLISKSYKQALAKTQYKIDDGYSLENQRSYHTPRYIWAKQLAKSEDRFNDVVLFMELYDWAYNYTCQNPGLSERQLARHVV